MNELDDPREPLPGVLIKYRTLVIILVHAFLFGFALFCAFLNAYNFRFDHGTREAPRYWFLNLFLPLLALGVPLKLMVFYWAKQFQGSWRYVGIRDIFGVTSASLIATFVFLTAYFAVENGWQAYSGELLIDSAATPDLRQSPVFFLDWAITIAFVCAARILVRFYYEDIYPRRNEEALRVLMIGAGNSGESALREMHRLQKGRYLCIGFLDDRETHANSIIHGAEVLGPTSQIREVCIEMGVREVWITMPKPGPKFIRQLVEKCEGTGVQFRTIPTIADVVEGNVHVSQIRDVDIADLLGRDPVRLDVEEIAHQLRGKRVLVTGAGGSIGSEMCRQVAAFHPETLALVEQAENNLFEIDRELRRNYPNLAIVPYVADIFDRKRMKNVFDEIQPSVVFHAAAHKHVPMMELNVGEAIKNNVGGTSVVAECALESGVEKMVMISTDKAVNPTSVMGCSKRVAERYVQTLNGQGSTQFVTVRFGNVLGSSGSVVPIFKQQIAAGGPVTVTHPDMVRYFMTITEAAQLVLQAGAMGRGGEIYVLRMGDPVKIIDLARDMVTLSGLRPGVDIEIKITGKRPGEKLFEELSFAGEDIGDTAHPKIGIWKHQSADGETIRAAVKLLLEKADSEGPSELIRELKRAVPEYTPEVNVSPAAQRNTSSNVDAVRQ